MANGEPDFLRKLAGRAFPGADRLVKSIDALEQGIESLEKKVGGLEGGVEERLSQVERGIDRVSRLAGTERRAEPSPRAGDSDSDQHGDAEKP